MTRGINLLVRFNGTNLFFLCVCPPSAQTWLENSSMVGVPLPHLITGGATRARKNLHQWPALFQDHPTNRKSPMAMDFMAYPKHEV